MKSKVVGLAALACSLLVVPATAHHSFAMFDAGKTVSLSGTVKEFEWSNPHTWVHLTVQDANGKVATWAFEGGSTGQLAQSGWKKDTIKPGDKIALEFHPLKDGSHGGQLMKITLPDGKSLCQGAECRKAAGIQD